MHNSIDFDSRLQCHLLRNFSPYSMGKLNRLRVQMRQVQNTIHFHIGTMLNKLSID